MRFRRLIAFLLVCAFLMTGCSIQIDKTESKNDSSVEMTGDNISEISDIVSDTVSIDWEPKDSEFVLTDFDSEDSLRYVEDNIYSNLVETLDSDEYFVENVEAIYYSQEYIDELNYNSQENIYFGYKLSDLDALYQGKRYIFTLDDHNNSVVKEFEGYDDTYDRVITNVAIGTGVILVCVTVSLVTAGAGAPAVSLIFATAAKSAAIAGASSGAIGGAAAGLTTGIATGNMDEAIKQAALSGSEEFKWGAIVGGISGGVGKAASLFGEAKQTAFTINEYAKIQKETKFPLDVIKQFTKKEQIEICKQAGLKTGMVNGKTAMIRNIDLNYVDEATGMTNLERMQKGLAALDPSGESYELHHIGQKADSTLAILTQEEHRLGDSYSIWHELVGESDIDRAAFDKIRKAFWKSLANSMS